MGKVSKTGKDKRSRAQIIIGILVAISICAMFSCGKKNGKVDDANTTAIVRACLISSQK